VAGTGRHLPARLWTAMVEKMAVRGDPWDGAWEVVPIELATAVLGPEGPQTPAEAQARDDCPDAPELTGRVTG
jgi:hypothetical protein